ncbi:hypothetical protein ACOMHN_025852 [Nucella lapillus]
MLCVGYYRAFGVFFVEILDTFQSSTFLTSTIMGLQAAVLSLSALVVHSVVLPLVGERRSALVGGLLMASGMTLATFATSIPFLLFSLSFLVGLGNAMTYGPGLVLVGQYFDRRRALAMSVANTGSSVGSMTLPLLATYLLRVYGLSGAWLLYGATTLHLCVFASLYRPLPSALRETPRGEGGAEPAQALLQDKKRGDDFGVPKTSANNTAEVEVPQICVETELVCKADQRKECLKEEMGNGFCDKEGCYSLPQPYLTYLGEGNNAKAFSSAENVSSVRPIVNRHLHSRRSSTLGDLRPPHHHHRHHHSSSTALSVQLQRKLIKDVAIHSSHPHLMGMAASMDSLSQDPRTVASESPHSGSSRQRCGGLWSSLACDGALLRKPLFWLVQLYACVGVVGATGAGVYLPALCREKGLDKDDTAVVLTIWGGLNLVGRLLCGVLADRQWVRPSHISLVSFLVIGVLFQLVDFLPARVESMVALAVVYGVFEGAYFTMLPLIIIEFLSLGHFSRTFGFVQLCQGAFSSLSYPLLG